MTNKIFYDSSSAGFYVEGINNEIPSSAIEITHEDYLNLLSGQESGKEINPDENGYPILTDPPALTQEQKVSIASNKKASLMSEASDAIAPLQDAIDLGDSTDEEESLLKSWKQYRVALNRLDLSKAPDISWPVKPE